MEDHVLTLLCYAGSRNEMKYFHASCVTRTRVKKKEERKIWKSGIITNKAKNEYNRIPVLHQGSECFLLNLVC